MNYHITPKYAFVESDEDALFNMNKALELLIEQVGRIKVEQIAFKMQSAEDPISEDDVAEMDINGVARALNTAAQVYLQQKRTDTV